MGCLLPGVGGCLVRGVSGQGVGVWSGGRQTPSPEMATAAVGTHPTGIHSCRDYFGGCVLFPENLAFVCYKWLWWPGMFLACFFILSFTTSSSTLNYIRSRRPL